MVMAIDEEHAAASQTRSCFHLDLSRLNKLVRAVEEDPSQANFTFSAKTAWRDAAATETRARGHVIHADAPEALGATDSAADPVELLLTALTSCIPVGLVTHAAKRGVELRNFEIDAEGDLDLRGYLGDDNVRPGFTAIRYTVRVDSDADPEVLKEIVRRAEMFSPMRDNILNGVPVSSQLELAPATT